jgi:hypothetical protein
MAFTARSVKSEEFSIFVERFVHFQNLFTVYLDLLSGHYVPTVNPPSEEWSQMDMRATMMLVLYAYFYSLIEDDHESLNAFRIWRQRYPEEEVAISAVESQVSPFRDRLKIFRNRLGFHGSRSRAHEARGFDLLKQHSGTEIWNAIKNFKSLGAALIAKSNDPQALAPNELRRWIDSITQRSKEKP